MLDLLLQTLDNTVSTMITVFLMLFLTGLMVEMNAFQRISHLARPLISISHLPAVSASTFVISLGSALAANTVIARLKAEGHLTERQAFLSAIMNSVPVYFRELFTYQLAFVIPVLGIFVGGAYAVISIATGLIKLALVLVLGRAYLPGDSSASSASSASVSSAVYVVCPVCRTIAAAPLPGTEKFKGGSQKIPARTEPHIPQDRRALLYHDFPGFVFKPGRHPAII